MRVRDIMTKKVACCTDGTPVRDVAQLMVDHDCGEIPVCDDEHKPIGVVTDRDIVCRIIAPGRDSSKARAADCMSTMVVTATPDMTIEDCARLMEQYQVRRLPVVDGNGACCGLVAQADLATKSSPEVTAEVVERVSQPTSQSAMA